MTPGAIVYRLRKTFHHGIRTAYYRDVVRPRILKTRPVCPAPNAACEIHVLTSSGDWLNLVWTLKSFYHFSSRTYGLCIHDDGTLPSEAKRALREHFPAARFIARDEADSAVQAKLTDFPRCLHLRRTNTLSLKLFDFRHYLQAERMLLIDSDILFFSEPAELVHRVDDPGYHFNSVNADVSSAYTVDPATVEEQFGFKLRPLFNSGLGLIHGASLRLDWIEEFLALPGILDHFWRIEQTLFALCSFRYGAELLPEEYRVKLDGESRGSCKHYIGAIRHHMYGQGISRLVRSGFLEATGA
ncbi:MAG: hypothetical protein JWO80_3409 [Bryobacterales bacterium]|nr:hypothetical protein [Bryobacterales bacterium]